MLTLPPLPAVADWVPTLSLVNILPAVVVVVSVYTISSGVITGTFGIVITTAPGVQAVGVAVVQTS